MIRPLHKNSKHRISVYRYGSWSDDISFLEPKPVILKMFTSSLLWEDNIKIDLQEVGGGCGDWMELAQDRDRWQACVSTVKNFRVP
jgi:hypothetical protein